MNPLEWMKQSWESVRHKTVKVINIPAPPTPVKGVIYMPSCWASKTYDQQFDRDEYKVITMEHTKYGPAVLMYMQLEQLIGFSDDNSHNGLLIANHSTCCATISAADLYSNSDGLVYVDEAVLDQLVMMERSCHPGSHYIVPQAPYLTAFLQYAQAPQIREERPITIQYLTPEDGEKLFPYCKFDSNTELDAYVRRCAISLDVSFFNTTGGLGKWSLPLLRELRRNQILMEGVDHERWNQRSFEGTGDASKEDDSEDVGSTEAGILQDPVRAEG
jgi:hypothetical protein